MIETNAFIFYWVAVVLLLCQYRFLRHLFSPQLFFNTAATVTEYSKIKWGAFVAFVCNLTAITIAYADRAPEVGSNHKLATVLYLQVFYYVIQWMYVPFLMLMKLTKNNANAQINNNLRKMVQLMLMACAALQIMAFVYLLDAPFTHTKGLRTSAVALQGIAFAWVTCYDFVWYSFFPTIYSLPEAIPIPRSATSTVTTSNTGLLTDF